MPLRVASTSLGVTKLLNKEALCFPHLLSWTMEMLEDVLIYVI